MNHNTTHTATSAIGVAQPATFSHKGKDLGTVQAVDHSKVEEVAIRMCLGMGLNPFEQATFLMDEGNCYPPPLPMGSKILISINGNTTGSQTEFMNKPMLESGPRWMGFKRKAAEALAAWAAVHATVLGS